MPSAKRDNINDMLVPNDPEASDQPIGPKRIINPLRGKLRVQNKAMNPPPHSNAAAPNAVAV
ncbi:hypothetical protein GCM10017612_34640 [Novosphingobium resinovorum]|nr:hypothetical protein GCM10017612_34640 [Novosphingobium resinovorum]